MWVQMKSKNIEKNSIENLPYKINDLVLFRPSILYNEKQGVLGVITKIEPYLDFSMCTFYVHWATGVEYSYTLTEIQVFKGNLEEVLKNGL
jgi:hypothetical protein